MLVMTHKNQIMNNSTLQVDWDHLTKSQGGFVCVNFAKLMVTQARAAPL